MTTEFHAERDFAVRLDEHDELREFRGEFLLPNGSGEAELIYLMGNSLGLQPKRTRDQIEAVLKAWADHGVEAFFEGDLPWMDYPGRLAEKLAILLGAKSNEIAVMNTLTVNLHLMLTSFFRPTGKRYQIVIGPNEFPSDRYAIQSQVALHDLPEDAIVELRPRAGEDLLRTEDVEEFFEEQGNTVALASFDGINYYTGQMLNLERITKAAHRAGCIIGFDLAHVVGNVPLSLHEYGADFAVWCTYKFLNGGPGAIGGCFVHERHLEEAVHGKMKRLAGWWGNNRQTQFLMRPTFEPAYGAAGWQVSTHPALLMACLDASLDIFLKAGMEALRQKSMRLTAYAEYLVREIRDPRISIISPSDPEWRGAALSLRFVQDGKHIQEKWYKRGVFTDWREPDVIRIAPVPLYNSFEEVWRAVEALKRCLAE